MQPLEMEMLITPFTHDFYLLQLPPRSTPKFLSHLAFYERALNFRGQPITFAPVIRIYGSNEDRVKCCLHVHGYFRSFSIKVTTLEGALKSNQSLVNFVQQIDDLFQAVTHTVQPVIYRAELQYLTDFYGYHTHPEPFLKIWIYDPSSLNRLRELLESGVMNGISFQCYDAHISYFMQLCADMNLYAGGPIKLSGFSFRRNIHAMPILHKFKPSLREGLAQGKWDLEAFYMRSASSFNSLLKQSTCYLQLDVTVDQILNEFVRDSQEGSCLSDSEIHSLAQASMQSGYKRKIKVEITKALEDIWMDQKKRRVRFNIAGTLEGVVDCSANIEATPEVQAGKDPLSANFIFKSDSYSRLLSMLSSFSQAPQAVQIESFRVERRVMESYSQILEQKKEAFAEKAKAKWKYYEGRKQKIINDIVTGERAELPEWDENEGAQESSEEQQVQAVDAGEWGSLRPAPDNNTVNYRGNFHFQPAKRGKQDFFSTCDSCGLRIHDCACEEDMLVDNDFRRSPCQEIELLEYLLTPPTHSDCGVIEIENEGPFYSSVSDIFKHYGICNYFEPELKYAQYLDRSLRDTNDMRPALCLRNNKKLPYYFCISESKEEKNIITGRYILEYTPLPPKLSQMMPLMKEPMASGTKQATASVLEDTFVNELLIVTFELLGSAGRGKHMANPQEDPILAIACDFSNSKYPRYSLSCLIYTEQCISLSESSKDRWQSVVDKFDEVLSVRSESDLLSLFALLITRVDVDILVSYDQERRGLNYLLIRGLHNEIDMSQALSRSANLEQIFSLLNFSDFQFQKSSFLSPQNLLFGHLPFRPDLHYRFTKRKIAVDVLRGRVCMNVQRICEASLKLRSYQFQAVLHHLFKLQLPAFPEADLIDILATDPGQVMDVLWTKTIWVKAILQSLNTIGMITEKTRVFGADFLSMMERGSQFKIEAVMWRTMRQQNLVSLSASRSQVAGQSILNCRPLVIEPPKQFLTEPVLVFDFQSLYPSVMIAHNICYSTCIGPLTSHFAPGKLTSLGVSTGISLHLDTLAELASNLTEKQAKDAIGKYVFVAPNKVGFVRKSLKEGLIPRILLQFLLSRVMIKDSSKLYPPQLKQLLTQRQTALKLFMNVLFGYTGASFSGRMPCAEIADAIVETAKYSLRKALDYLNQQRKYPGRVIYGDTDSLFFHLPKHSLAQAFEAGRVLAAQITKLFPYPMELKFQKVYDCIFLISKKRYYGRSYQSPEAPARYEGKGLQTVRRDSLPFTAQAMQTILDLLIKTKDVSAIKSSYLSQLNQLLSGQVPIGKMCLAKEVRLLSYLGQEGPAHVEAAKKNSAQDASLQPIYGERMKYLVLRGHKTLRDRAIGLAEYMKQPPLPLDLNYYSEKLFIPPLQRALISIVNLATWGSEFKTKEGVKGESLRRCTHHCIQGKTPKRRFCEYCLNEEIDSEEQKLALSRLKCEQCCGFIDGVNRCVEWNCGHLFERRDKDLRVSRIRKYGEIIRANIDY